MSQQASKLESENIYGFIVLMTKDKKNDCHLQSYQK